LCFLDFLGQSLCDGFNVRFAEVYRTEYLWVNCFDFDGARIACADPSGQNIRHMDDCRQSVVRFGKLHRLVVPSPDMFERHRKFPSPLEAGAEGFVGHAQELLLRLVERQALIITVNFGRHACISTMMPTSWIKPARNASSDKPDPDRFASPRAPIATAMVMFFTELRPSSAMARSIEPIIRGKS